MSSGPVVWVDGSLVASAEARVSVFDHGFLVGDGVFETLVTRDGVPFAWERHDARLRRSAAKIGLEVPGAAVLREAVAAVVAENGFASGDGRLRITVTGGIAEPGSVRGGGAVTAVVSVTGLATWPATADVVTVPWPRNERGALAGVKATSYAENVVALEFARKRGASEAIFGNTVGNLCEGTGSNIFLVWEGRLVTPTLGSGCLAGVTREIVLELAAADGVPVAEEDVPLRTLPEAEEVFLTSTTRHVQPVMRVDGKTLGNRVPGPVTGRLAALFAERFASGE